MKCYVFNDLSTYVNIPNLLARQYKTLYNSVVNNHSCLFGIYNEIMPGRKNTCINESQLTYVKLLMTIILFLKEDFIRKSTKHNTKLQLFTKYTQTHHHIEFKHCTP